MGGLGYLREEHILLNKQWNKNKLIHLHELKSLRLLNPCQI